MLKKLALVLSVTLVPVTAFADGDAAKGERVFKKCKACHQVGEGAENKVGPVLNNIIGRPVAAVEDFKYSDVLMGFAEEGKTWTEEELAAFLAAPKKYAEGTKMSFAGLRKEKDQANLIAYLATFSEAPAEEEAAPASE